MTGRCLPLVLAHDERHGTRTGYVNHGCRCDRCKAAYRAHNAELRRAGLAPDDRRHGTTYAYSVYGCRCDECRRAKSDAKTSLRRRRQGGAA